MRKIIRIQRNGFILILLSGSLIYAADYKTAPSEPDPSAWRSTPAQSQSRPGYWSSNIRTEAESAGSAPVQSQPQPGYWGSTFSPEAGLSTAVHAGIGQAIGRPYEWGGGLQGFGKRAASGFGTHLVKNTIEFPMAAILHENLRYQKSTDTTFGPRLRHALISTVWTTKTNTGKDTVAYSRLTGTFGSGLISRLWQPASARSFATGFSTAGISLGVHAGTNVLREFWPRPGGSKQAPLPPTN
jgi:hypothetical protein